MGLLIVDKGVKSGANLPARRYGESRRRWRVWVTVIKWFCRVIDILLLLVSCMEVWTCAVIFAQAVTWSKVLLPESFVDFRYLVESFPVLVGVLQIPPTTLSDVTNLRHHILYRASLLCKSSTMHLSIHTHNVRICNTMLIPVCPPPNPPLFVCHTALAGAKLVS